ncbi:hypothetical protein EVAR_97225_1 [Eumeta japonica]|uniref:DUF4371 domain-containing protein n=1 Tax=Eumeta variegata TaxID=151549 RepID=A0A4C2A2U6_EUMVA|nr:hypothetical protein EVAR_97225_1 [Eumeta japonica]
MQIMNAAANSHISPKAMLQTGLHVRLVYQNQVDHTEHACLSIPKLGIGIDNAAVMVGVNKGVHAKLKRELPSLVLVLCVCHSLQLAVSAVTKQFLPRNLEFIIKETYHWFSRSSSRQTAHKELYKFINDDHDPLKIVQFCQTRSARQSYGDDAVGYVHLHRNANLCTVKCKISPEDKVRSKPYSATMVVDEETV